MLFSNGSEWWKYCGDRDEYAVGTSLCYRVEWWEKHNFEEVQVGEDNEFVKEARRRDQLVTIPAGDLMFASIHNSNTSPRALHRSPWIKYDERLISNHTKQNALEFFSVCGVGQETRA